MLRHLDTPIASIYDMMIERHRKLTYKSESKDISVGAQKVPRGKTMEDATSNTKIWPKKQRTTKAVNEIPSTLTLVREMPSTLTLVSESYRPSSTITASHLTKKQTVMKVQPPAKKEVISKLVEKMSMACARPKTEAIVLQPSPKSPKQVSARRKGNATQGSSRNKQKPNKSNPDRRPLSPRKAADRGPKVKKVERVPKEKTKPKATPKLPKSPGPKVRSVRESNRSLKTAPPSNDRWRI